MAGAALVSGQLGHAVAYLVSGAWGLVEGCGTALTVGLLAVAALGFLFAILRWTGEFLGLCR